MAWSREERSLAAGLVVLALAGAGWLLAGRLTATGAAAVPEADDPGIAGLSADDQPAAADDAASTGGAAASDRVGQAPGVEGARPILVHVAGAVQAPGVYRLPDGARVVDAVTAAGGPTDDAAVDAVNLAAPVVDGSRLYIPSLEEVEAHGPPVGDARPGDTGGTGVSAGDGVFRPVAVNRATPDELQHLPGIGPVLAQRIVAYRQRHGPFQTVEDLLGVSGIGPKTLEQLRPHVVVP